MQDEKKEIENEEPVYTKSKNGYRYTFPEKVRHRLIKNSKKCVILGTFMIAISALIKLLS